MENFIISNFRFGLDARRSELTSQPGTAMLLENGHVNSGGEIEKRKAFVGVGTVSQLGFGVPTFGLEATDEGLVVFASQEPVTYPAGTTVQLLVHPATGSLTLPQLSAVIGSCNFNGKAFVIARFDNGNVLFFYDGVVVGQSIDGLVYPDYTILILLALNLTAAINDIEGWVATANGDGSVTVKSPPGVYFTPVPEKETTDGLLGYTLIDKDHAGSAGTSAVASFQITVNGTVSVDTYVVTAPRNSDGSGEVTLCNTFAAASAAATAAAIKSCINDNTYLTGYSATLSGNIIYVYAPQSWGATANGLTATMTYSAGTAGGGGGGTGGTLACNIDLATNETIRVGKGSANVFSRIVHASGVGGTAPYTYLWAAKPLVPGPGDQGDGITISSPTAASTNFHKTLSINTSAYGKFTCTVTDSLGGVAVSTDVTVLLENDSIN